MKKTLLVFSQARTATTSPTDVADSSSEDVEQTEVFICFSGSVDNPIEGSEERRKRGEGEIYLIRKKDL